MFLSSVNKFSWNIFLLSKVHMSLITANRPTYKINLVDYICAAHVYAGFE